MKKVEYQINKKEWTPSLIPGPMALISTCNAAKDPNVAPMSWIQIVAFDPPTLMLSTGKETTTAKNILAVRCFVVNLVDSSLAQKSFQSIECFGRAGYVRRPGVI